MMVMVFRLACLQNWNEWRRKVGEEKTHWADVFLPFLPFRLASIQIWVRGESSTSQACKMALERLWDEKGCWIEDAPTDVKGIKMQFGLFIKPKEACCDLSPAFPNRCSFSLDLGFPLKMRFYCVPTKRGFACIVPTLRPSNTSLARSFLSNYWGNVNSMGIKQIQRGFCNGKFYLVRGVFYLFLLSYMYISDSIRTYPG